MLLIGRPGIVDRKDVEQGIFLDLEPDLVFGSFVGFVKVILDIFFIDITIQCPRSDTVAVGGGGIHLILSDENEVIVIPDFYLVDNITVGQIIGYFSVFDQLHLDHLP